MCSTKNAGAVGQRRLKARVDVLHERLLQTKKIALPVSYPFVPASGPSRRNGGKNESDATVTSPAKAPPSGLIFSASIQQESLLTLL